jgi:ribose transport system substrate-binding protein
MDQRTAVALTVLLAFALPGASAQEEPPAESRLRIAFIAKSYANPVFLAAHRGAQDAARKLSDEQGIPVEVLVLTPTGEDPELQAHRIGMAVEQGAQAIAVAASDTAPVTKAIEEAASKGVAVMTFDVDLPESKRFAHYGADDARTGEMVVDELAQLIGETGKVAVLAGNPDAPNLQRRVAGLKKAAERHAGIEVVGVFHHVERPVDAAEEVLRVNAAHPDLKGWAMVGGWPLFESHLSSRVLKDLKSLDLKVVAVDALPEQLVYVDEGVAVLFAQPVYEWGTVSIKTIVDKLHFKKDVSGSIPMELVRVSGENLGEWARQLRDWGFRAVPEEYLERE